MLAGWLARGLPPSAVWVVDPQPSDWLRGTGVNLNCDMPAAPAVVLVAVKPQMMAEALPTLQDMGNSDTLFVSVAAGTTIGYFEGILGAETPIVRAMPNTPAAISKSVAAGTTIGYFEGILGAETPIVRAMPNTPAAISKGITAIVGNAKAGSRSLDEAETLLSAVGEVVRLEQESQIDAVTGVSGSGPAYVFHMIECLAAAGVAQGLPDDMAMQLAKATVAGAGALAMEADEDPGQLRVNVTSPNGTTQAALEVLMDEANGFPPLLIRAVAAAADRSRELANG